jgi:hypothetical protein
MRGGLEMDAFTQGFGMSSFWRSETLFGAHSQEQEPNVGQYALDNLRLELEVWEAWGNRAGISAGRKPIVVFGQVLRRL